MIAEAADWLARLDAGTAEPAAFARWRDADPAHAAAFAQVVRTWGLMDRLRGEADLRPAAAAAPSRPVNGLSRRAWLRAASVAGLSLAGGGLLTWSQFRPAYASTNVGERQRLTLDDGSFAELNTDSAISWRFDEESRQVWLERGEASFTVVADGRRPFRLKAGAMRTELAAGQFNVRRLGEALDLRVIAGQAQVAGAGPVALPVDARHGLLVTKRNAVARALSEAEIQATTAWLRGEIVFDGTPLSTAIAEFNRYQRRKLVISDPGIANLRLGGRFASADQAAFIAALEGTFGIRAVEADAETLLLSRGTPRHIGG